MRHIGPIRAALISMAGLGLGYIYVGRIRLAMIVLFLTVGLVAVAGWTRFILVPSGTYVFAGGALLVFLLPVLHSAVIARRKRSMPARKYNRWWIYVLWGAGSLLLAEAYAGVRADWFGFEPFRLPGRSMAPTLEQGDFVMADTWRFDRVDPEYGELVVFESPDGAGMLYVKRVSGLPGDRIEIRNDVLYRNGVAIEEPYVLPVPDRSGMLSNFRAFVVPENGYFVLGDNRHNSRDSRFFGPVPRDLLHGRIEHRWFAYDGGVRWERFPATLSANGR